MKFRLFQNYRQWKRKLISVLAVEIERTRAIVPQKCETNWPYLNLFLFKKKLFISIFYILKTTVIRILKMNALKYMS